MQVSYKSAGVAGLASFRTVEERMTVQSAADPSHANEAGKQCRTLNPYMKRSTASPGAVNRLVQIGGGARYSR